MSDKLRDQIEKLIRKMLYPSPLMAWMDGLTQAERIGRIKRSKMSALRYCLRQFLVTQISAGTEVYDTFSRVTITPMDDEVLITVWDWEKNEGSIIVAYPDWLLDFLDDDENFALLLPDCEEKVGEVTQRIYEWCHSHPPYDILVAT